MRLLVWFCWLVGPGLSRENVWHHIVSALLVLNRIIKADEFNKSLMLEVVVEPLLQEVLEALVVRLDDELVALQIMSPFVDRHENSHEFLLVC